MVEYLALGTPSTIPLYWKGLLSHDLEPNPTYREAGVFGREIAKPIGSGSST